jgi:uncharacterized protein YbjT (DUF2867 family)
LTPFQACHVPKRAVITGAFSYTGAAVASELLARGWHVHTLTNRKGPSQSRVSASDLRFDSHYLREQLAGNDVFINTYWIRLPLAGQTFGTAVERSAMLLDAAVAAKVPRVVHVSVSNARLGKNLGYYRGKAEVEEHLRGLPVRHAIVRPTLVVGPGDVLSNNIAWLLRRFPVLLVPAWRCRLQPIVLADCARVIADAAGGEDDVELDAAGPDIMTFIDYVRLIARAARLRRIILRAPSWLALAGLGFVEPIVRDVILTREELLGLEQELLVSHETPRGSLSVSSWLERHGHELGRDYVNDRRRHFGKGKSEMVLDPGRLGHISEP